LFAKSNDDKLICWLPTVNIGANHVEFICDCNHKSFISIDILPRSITISVLVDDKYQKISVLKIQSISDVHVTLGVSNSRTKQPSSDVFNTGIPVVHKQLVGGRFNNSNKLSINYLILRYEKIF